MIWTPHPKCHIWPYMVFEIKSGVENLNITLNQFVPHNHVITLLCLDSNTIYDDDIGLEEGCVLASQLSRAVLSASWG